MSKTERYSKVSRRMWNDARFRSLSAPAPNGQTLWKRLLTGPELTNIPGCFQAWEAGLAQALGWPLEGFSKAFAEVSRQGMAKADWSVGLIWVPNAIKHNKPESPNVVRSWKATWDELPECALKLEAYRTLKAFVEELGEGFAQAFAEGCSRPSGGGDGDPSPNQEQEQEQEQERPPTPLEGDSDSEGDSDDPEEPAPPVADAESVRKVFEFWKREHGHPKAKLDPKRQRRIRARLREGFTGRELCIAIRAAKQDKFLMGENSSGTVYDGIETLLRDAAKVESLLELGGHARGEPKAAGSDPAAARGKARLERMAAEAKADQERALQELQAKDPQALERLARTGPALAALTEGIGG